MAKVSSDLSLSQRTRPVYHEFLRHDGVIAALVATPAALRAPRQVWETMRYGGWADHGGLPTARSWRLPSPSVHEAGVAFRLVDAALEELRHRKIDTARVVTATGNTRARRVYERAGFRRQRLIEVHRGVQQEVLVWP